MSCRALAGTVLLFLVCTVWLNEKCKEQSWQWRHLARCSSEGSCWAASRTQTNLDAAGPRALLL